MIPPERALEFFWGALGFYWLFSALGTKKNAIHEHSGLRVFRLWILGMALMLVLSRRLGIGPLAWRFVPNSAWIIWSGVLLTGLGVGLAIWARSNLGRNWSDKVVLKVDHELIRTGPYAYLRHPIYSGVLLAVVGSALTAGEWRGVLAVVLLGANYCVKAVREEKILAANFGDAFIAYKRETGFFLPGL